MTETAQLTLAEFLRARIAEPAAKARYQRDKFLCNGGGWPGISKYERRIRDPWYVDQIPRWLEVWTEEIERRGLLEECLTALRLVPSRVIPEDCALRIREAAESTLRGLAAEYRDHPDYNPEWCR